VALVTGAGRGLGRAIASELSRHGARVALTARTAREIRTTARALERAGGQALAHPCDVRDPRQVAELLAATVARFRNLDILVNNAGVFRMAPLQQTDEAMWDDILDTNLKGTYLVTRAALPQLERRKGQIVNILSTAARIVYPDNTAYCASKWGLLGFTNALRDELRPRGIRVSAVLPGAVDTPIWDDVPGHWERDTMLRPDAVARAVAHVCTQVDSASTDEILLTPARRA
jgi:NAD(P)-dependent dehydrogenase (short-subunit alcohol dehydrogenase family)